jgi:hypothetical protein
MLGWFDDILPVANGTGFHSARRSAWILWPASYRHQSRGSTDTALASGESNGYSEYPWQAERARREDGSPKGQDYGEHRW